MTSSLLPLLASSNMAAEGSEIGSNGGVQEVPVQSMAAEAPPAAPAAAAEVSQQSQSELGDDGQMVTETYEEEEGELPVDFNRLWKVCHDNPLEFSSWTDLLQYCEQEGHTGAYRRALEAFLIRYPLCYGYWKRYTDLEKRIGNTHRAQEVCVRGLKSIPLSLDLWIHYINLLRDTLDMNLPESTQHIRSAFEAAVGAAGLEFHSDRLWEMYTEWERDQGDLRAVTAVYDRILRIPTQMYSGHLERLKAHISAHRPQDILSAEEVSRLRSEVHKPPQSETVTEEKQEAKPSGEEPQNNPDPTPQDSEEDTQKMRELLLADRQKVYQQNEAEVSKRWAYEEAIKRPYFHVKPLDRGQLKAWHTYLDWELSEAHRVGQEATSEGQHSVAGHQRVLILFERCLIACALYEEFWTKYVRYVEQYSVEDARNVYRRACEIHLSHKHTIHLQWATFEERYGNVTEARRILRTLEEAMPGLAMVRLRRAGLERRTGRLDQAEQLLREAVLQSRETPVLHAFYSIKLARMLLKLCKNMAGARSVLLEAIQLNPDNGKLHMNLLELEVAGDLRGSCTGVQQCVSRALEAPLSPNSKTLFSQRGLQFAEDFGATVQSVLTVYDEHQKLLKDISNKKRAAENGDGEDAEKTSRVEESSAYTTPSESTPAPPVPMPPPMMSGDMSAAQSWSNYSSWYQQQYSGYNYQNPWNYNQYYSQS